MILKRMGASLRRQDWAMVFIEFVLVVVGVVLGFQIDDWANRRSEAKHSREAMERLLDETERDVAYLKLAVSNEETLVADMHLALDRLEKGRWTSEEAERMERGLRRGRYLISLAPPTSVYEDVVASGALGRFDDAGVRQTIGEFHSTLSFEERMRQHFERSSGNYEGNAAFSYDPDPTGQKPARFLVDFDALSRDRAAWKSIARTAENVRLLAGMRRVALKDAIQMCQAIGTAIARPCNVNRPAPTFG